MSDTNAFRKRFGFLLVFLLILMIGPAVLLIIAATGSDATTATGEPEAGAGTVLVLSSLIIFMAFPIADVLWMKSRPDDERTGFPNVRLWVFGLLLALASPLLWLFTRAALVSIVSLSITSKGTGPPAHVLWTAIHSLGLLLLLGLPLFVIVWALIRIWEAD